MVEPTRRTRRTTATLCACLLAAALLGLPLAAPAGALIQQGPKMTALGELESGQLGRSVAISADGNTAIVGAPQDNEEHGAAWIFVRSGGVWTQQGPKLTGAEETGKGRFGWSVALSGDGETALVGANADHAGTGAFWVFVRSGGVWTQQGGKLSGSGETGAANQGQDVALSTLGNTALIGGPQDNGGVGAAWVFTRGPLGWTEQEKLTATGEEGVGEVGYSVGLSGDGNTALLGAPGDNNSVGAAFLFTRSGSTWSPEGGKLLGGEEVSAKPEFGYSAALSRDGSTALVGGPFESSLLGAAWAFKNTGTGLVQQGPKLEPFDPAGASHFGWSISLSEHGGSGLIGGSGDEANAGAAWQFMRTGESWAQHGAKLTGGEESGKGSFGASTALSADGDTALIGGPEDTGSLGAWWAFSNIPLATTTAASGVSRHLAVLNGTALDSDESRAYFQFGTTSAYGYSTALQTIVPTTSPVAVTAGIGGLQSGTTYHYRIVEESSGGVSYGTDATFTTDTEPPATPALVRPIITKLHQKSGRWRIGRSLARFSRSTAPFGTTFTFVLNVPAAVKLSFSHLVAGRRVGHNCVAKTRANLARRACLRRVTVGALQHGANAGLNTVFFSGRLSATHRLSTGTYMLTLTAKAVGGSSAPASLTFVIVR